MCRFLPLRIAIKDSLVLILLVIFNTIHVTDLANNDMDIQSKQSKTKDDSNNKVVNFNSNEDYLKNCPIEQENVSDCSGLNYPCINCNRDIDCIYGGFYNYTCVVKAKIICNGSKTFNRTAMCRFCYQTEKWEHRCEQKANCNSLGSPTKYYLTNCTVSDDIICLGKRKFLKKVRCSWTSGTRWGTALVLALTLGGFGADRFYLGHWQEGIGKLFSFGGLGVWTLVDALLIGIHHLGPADGSVYELKFPVLNQYQNLTIMSDAFYADAWQKSKRRNRLWCQENLMTVLLAAKERRVREIDDSIALAKKLLELYKEPIVKPRLVPLHELVPLEDDSLMKPIEPEVLNLLYGCTEKGAARKYLRARCKKAPEDKFYFRLTSNWDYGWQQQQARVKARDENHGRCAILRDTFYRKSNLAPDPPHYSKPAGGEFSICSEYSCNAN